MKQKLLVFALALIFSLAVRPTFGQDASSEESPFGLKLGFRVGATVSKFNYSQPHTSEKLGVIAGVVVEYGLSEKFSLQTEPSYLQQGGQYVRFSDNTRFGDEDNIFAIYTTSSRITAHYVDVPLLGKYKLMSLGNFQPNLVLGGSFGYLINAQDNFDRTYHYNQTFFTVHGTETITKEYEKYQIGATAGIGGEVSLGSKRLLIDFRYRYGITPAKKSYSYIDLKAVQGDLRTDSFYFTVGLGL